MTKMMMVAAAAAVLMVPTMASAQASTINATASVADYMNMGGSTNDLAFGTLSRTAANTISATSGAVTRTVTFNRNVAVSFSNVPTVLDGAVSSYQLPVTLSCAWQMGGTWNTAATCGTETFDLDVGTGLTSATLGFGGTITAAAAAAAVADSYAGVMTITVVAR